MGINATTLGYIHECLFLACDSIRFDGLEMCELGDQTLKLEGWIERPKTRILAKTYFDRMGFNHTSIDIHGEYGSVPFDLSKPITDEKYLNRFDVLTNLGTAEHVENQYECFKNIHNLVKTGGIFIHIVPMSPWERKRKPSGIPYGAKNKHCNYYYKNRFAWHLCKANDYFPVSVKTFLMQGTFGFCLKKIYDKEFRPSKEEVDSWIEKI